EGMSLFLDDYAPIESSISARSVVVAYCAGVVITFGTVVLSSWKVSRINIVSAIRDMPEISVHHRNMRSLLWGVLLLLAGGFLAVAGASGSQLFFLMAGLSLLPFGLALILGYFGVPGRPVYSFIGVTL